MKALLKKELRALLPVTWVAALLFSGDFVVRPFYQRLDELSWLDVSSLDSPTDGVGVILAFLAIAMAFSALPREHDEGTIAYLYALPVSRLSIFVAKVLAGVLALSAVVVLGEITNALLQSQNHQSFSGEQWRLSLVVGMVGLKITVGVCFYAYGILCSWLRRFGMAVLAFGALVVFKIKDQSPHLSSLDPLHLLSYRYHAQELTIPWRDVALQLLGAALCLTLAGVLWMNQAERISHWFQEAAQKRRSRWLLRGGTLLAFGLGLAAFVAVVSEHDEPDVNVLVQRSFGSAQATSKHFTFTYPISQRERALTLIGQADEEWRYIKTTLGAGDYRGLVVDLTDDSGEHDGIAAWSKARVSLTRLEEPEYARFVLVHELAHIAQQRVSGRRLIEHGASTAFFSEGMAQYVAHQRVPRPEARALERIVALETLHRQHIPFELLADRVRLRELVPPTADYLLGELWTQALVEQCGADAPKRVLISLARADAPQGLSSRALWDDTLQAMHCDLEAVLSTQARTVGELRARYAEQLAAIPRLSGGLAQEDDEQVVMIARTDRPLPSDAKVVMTVREDSSADDHDYQYIEAVPEKDDPHAYRMLVSRERFAGDRFQFAFGVELADDVYALFEPFRDARLSRNRK